MRRSTARWPPGVPPGVSFRMLFVGYFEGIDSCGASRGAAATACRCAAVLFEKHPTITPNVEVGLLRWFCVASLRGCDSGSGETAMDEDGVVQPAQARWNLAAGRAFGAVTADEFDDA